MDNSFLLEMLLKLKSGEKPDMMSLLLPFLLQTMNKKPEKTPEPPPTSKENNPAPAKNLDNFEILD